MMTAVWRRCLHKSVVDRMLRVDHAGEYAAVRIYEGQLAALGKDAELKKLLTHMKENEEDHLRAIEERIPTRRVRPSLLLPLWGAAGYGLGLVTACIGKEAAMACTVAVEQVISSHYNDQIREIIADTHNTDDDLLAMMKQHRDDELEHLSTGIAHDAEKAPAYNLLTDVIKIGCRGAIWVSERI